jgi:antibiotic biosynthesis monooxygenase (ABM) superfamily enzyme
MEPIVSPRDAQVGGATVQAHSTTVYVATTSVEPAWEEEFNRWYDEEHLPNLLRVPGYLSAQRYVAVEGDPAYLAFYEIDSIDAHRGEAHERAVTTPWTARIQPHRTGQLTFYEQVFPDQGLLPGPAGGDSSAVAGGLLVVRMDVDPAHEADFNAWYNEEHLPALCGVPGVIGARRFRAIEGAPAYMATYYLTEPAVQASEAWKRAIDTPWSARVRPAFRNLWRVVYQPLPAAERASVAGPVTATRPSA